MQKLHLCRERSDSGVLSHCVTQKQESYVRTAYRFSGSQRYVVALHHVCALSKKHRGCLNSLLDRKNTAEKQPAMVATGSSCSIAQACNNQFNSDRKAAGTLKTQTKECDR